MRKKSFFVLSVLLILAVCFIYIGNFVIIPAWAACSGCVNNTNNQILTIFKFKTQDFPFLAGNATFLVTPNPFSYTTFDENTIDPSVWGTNLIITDNDPLDADPMLGVVELVGVNNGTYSIFELRSPTGLLPNDEPLSSDEIFGTISHVDVTNILPNISSTSGSISMPPPIIPSSTLNSLTGSGAKINGMSISSSDQLPSSIMVGSNNAFTTTPPSPVKFNNPINSAISTSNLFSTLGIPTYDAPDATTLSSDIAFIPPVFVAQDNLGGNFVMTPRFQSLSSGTNLNIRLDNTGIGAAHSPIDAISIPLASNGNDVALRLKVYEEVPAGMPPSPSDTAVLFLDVDAIGDIDFSNPSSFSQNPTLRINVNRNADGSCPTTVTTYLLQNGGTPSAHWHNIGIMPTSNPSANTIHTCAFIQPVEHFSAYLVGGTLGHSHGGGHSHRSHSQHEEHIQKITNQLSINEVAYSVCSINIAKIVVSTTGKLDSLVVQLQSEKGGLSPAKLSTSQPYSSQNIHSAKKTYYFEAPIQTNEKSFTVIINDGTYELHKNMQIYECVGRESNFSYYDLIKTIDGEIHQDHDVQDKTMPDDHADVIQDEILEKTRMKHDEHEQKETTDNELVKFPNDDHSTHVNSLAPASSFQGIKTIATFGDTKFPIKYKMDGNIVQTIIDIASKSVTFNLENVKDGELLIALPRTLVDAANNNFIILVTTSQEQEIEYEIVSSTDERYTLKMVLPEGSSKLTIQGTNVIPEFGLSSVLILVIVIVGTILFTEVRKLNPLKY
jgi:hypothetical protein